MALEIARIILPIVVVGGTVVFIVFRMKYKYQKGTVGKKKSKSAQNLLDCLIPFGMMAGFVVALLVSIFTPFSPLSAIAWGPGIGMLFGYFAYEIYSKKEDSFT